MIVIKDHDTNSFLIVSCNATDVFSYPKHIAYISFLGSKKGLDIVCFLSNSVDLLPFQEIVLPLLILGSA